MGSMGRALAWRAAGSGLENIGALLTRQRAQSEEQKRYDAEEALRRRGLDDTLSLTVAERGGGMGSIPTRAAIPSLPGTMSNEATVGALDSDINVAPPSAGVAAGPNPDYVSVAGGRAYVQRPELRPENAADIAYRNTEAARAAAQTERERAYADLANRRFRGVGNIGARLTAEQQREFQRISTQRDDNARVLSGVTAGLDRTYGAGATLPDVATAQDSTQVMRRDSLQGVDARFAARQEALTRGGAAPTSGLIPVSQDEYDKVVADSGRPYAQRYFTVR
jgi:hypothetical protein